ncbi:hypothetical protein WK25_18205 [Burkholderia latens]|nr:hypothetical protein WK25_18205 [Burkholderia latens]
MMLESDVGLTVAATLQNAGRPLIVAPVGGAKSPAGMFLVRVKVVSAIVVEERSEQLGAAVWLVTGAVSVSPPHPAVNKAADTTTAGASADGESRTLPSFFLSIAFLRRQ